MPALLMAGALFMSGTAPLHADNDRHDSRHGDDRDSDNGPEIVRPDEHYRGTTYGELTVAWWQWALGIPAAQNPVLDTTGQFASVGQRGPIWFLAGTFGDSVQRTVTIPRGKAIFMPVHNWIFGASVFDCDPSAPGVPCDVPTLRAAAAAATTSAQTVEVSIDGKSVKHIRNYRAVSPGTFSVTFPQGAALGFPAGTFAPHVADGYWLLLEPLDRGQHTIRVRVTNPAYGVDYQVIYHIRIK